MSHKNVFICVGYCIGLCLKFNILGVHLVYRRNTIEETTQWMESGETKRQLRVKEEREERRNSSSFAICLALELEAEIRGIGSKLEQAKNKKQ
jgi:hypothetical protein